MIKNIFINMTLIAALILTNIVNAQSLSFLSNNNKIEDNSTPLSVDEAFHSDLENLGEEINIILDIKNNHYLYKDKIELYYNDEKQNIKGLRSGKMVNDDFFGLSEIYEYGFSFTAESKFSIDTNVVLKYQGCSKEFNLCYPPKIKEYNFKGDIKYKAEEPKTTKKEALKETKIEKEKLSTKKLTELATTNDANSIVELIKEYKDTPLIYLIFIVLGVFIAFTPCIYPLMPIVIASTSNAKNKSLATLSYIFGMVICYALIGIITGYLNFNLQIFAQNSYFIFGISIILFVLAMYMMGFINVILPSKTNDKIMSKINRINPDKYFNQVLIGFLSSLVLSPCSIAPLLGVLIFINQLGEPIFGSTLLASMAIGIGVPIFLLSTSFNKFMPKNGAWMDEMKNIIGIVILFIMIYLLTSEIGQTKSVFLYSLVSMIYGLHLLSVDNRKKIGVLMFTFSILMANYKLSEEKQINNINRTQTEILNYKVIENLNDLNKAISNSDKPIFIDYYADWCVTCVKMDNTTLKSDEIIKELNNNYFMIKIDLTDITLEKQKIMDSNAILALPYYSIINKSKKEFVYTGELTEKNFRELLIKHNR